MASEELRRLERLRTDFAYWAENLYRISDKSDEIVPLVLNKPQKHMLGVEQRLLEERGRARIFNLKARQAGFSTKEQAQQLWTIWSDPNTKVLTLADVRENTDKIFKITRTALKRWPQPALMPEKGGALKREIEFPERGSVFWTGTAGASTAGLGVTLKRFHGSEFAMWKEPKATLNSVSPGLERPGTSIVLETTAGAHGSEAHELFQRADSEDGEYTAVFYPWWECDPIHYRRPLEAPDELGEIEPEEKMLMERHGLDVEQIKWRRIKIAEMTRTEFFNQYAEDSESCWLVTGDLYYDGDMLYMLEKTAPEPKRREPIHLQGWNGEVKVFSDQAGFEWQRENVVIGVDTAEGGGGDRSAWVARSQDSWGLLETFADASITPKNLAELLNDRGRKFGNALLVVEKNGHGITVLRELRDEHRYPIGKIYHRRRADRPMQEQTPQMGWVTTAQSKFQMLDAGRDLIRSAYEGEINGLSKETVQDAFNVTRDERAKVDLNGKDMLVAEMLAWLGRDYSVGGYGSFTAAV